MKSIWDDDLKTKYFQERHEPAIEYSDAKIGQRISL
jgi:hypothetical protein